MILLCVYLKFKHAMIEDDLVKIGIAVSESISKCKLAQSKFGGKF